MTYGNELPSGLTLPFDRNVDVIGWDLDSTMFSTRGRHGMIPLIRAGHATWDDYAMACESDKPFPGAVALCHLLSQVGRQVAISGRSALALDLTWKVVRHYKIPLDDIMLRPSGDLTPTAVFKVARIRDLERQGYIVRLFLEDDPEVAELIMQMTGVPVMVVNPCYPPAESILG